MAQVRVATICMTSGSVLEKNLKKAYKYIEHAAKENADWILLPEIFAYNGPYAKLADVSRLESERVLEAVQGWAQKFNVVIFAGTLGEPPEDSKSAGEVLGRKGYSRVYNTMWVVGRDGGILAKYRKTHLFNLVDSCGEVLYSEADGFLPGDSGAVLNIEGFSIGLAVCYDLRFSEYFHLLQKMALCDVFMVPAAFTKRTGKAHWELLLRARAVEFQAYVVAANQVGVSSPGKETFGHSMLVDPWGDVVVNTKAQEGIAIGDVCSEKIKEIRDQLPVLKNRRPKLYNDSGL